MVQEFYVLKCYSCETYQVQQVKKSKKWNCKMCGEKQSVLKEFGRGSGVDCRRHVQKLNARRGEVLEQDQKDWSQWKEVVEKQLVEKVEEHVSPISEEAKGSRWTKYLQTTDEDTADVEDEEENVCMDRNRLHVHRNLRTRKRGREENGSRRSHLSGEEDPIPPSSWRTRGKPMKTQHDGQSSSFAPVDWPPNQSGVHRQPLNVAAPPSTTRSTFPAPTVASYRAITSQPHGSGTNEVTQASKWAQFLTSASPDEEHDDTSWSATTTLEDDFQTIGSIVPEVLNKVLVDQNYTKPPRRTSGCVGKTVDRLKSTLIHCGFEEMASSGGAGHTVLPQENNVPVCHQPPPTKRTCSTLSLGTLFYTDDDFDDTF